MPRELKSGQRWLQVKEGPLSLDDVASFCRCERAGAVVIFSGDVRDHSEGRTGVTQLEYEAYDEQAVETFSKISEEAFERFGGLCRVAIHHRLGLCHLGESTVLVGAAAEHRDSAFEAAKFCIDVLKVAAPIWKKEHWRNGQDWSVGASEIKPVEEW